MNRNGNKSGLIIGINPLAQFLGVSEPTVYEYLKMGMPGQKIRGNWHFHKIHIEAFFMALTKSRPDQNEINSEIEKIGVNLKVH